MTSGDFCLKRKNRSLGDVRECDIVTIEVGRHGQVDVRRIKLDVHLNRDFETLKLRRRQKTHSSRMPLTIKALANVIVFVGRAMHLTSWEIQCKPDYI